MDKQEGSRQMQEVVSLSLEGVGSGWGGEFKDLKMTRVGSGWEGRVLDLMKGIQMVAKVWRP